VIGLPQRGFWQTLITEEFLTWSRTGWPCRRGSEWEARIATCRDTGHPGPPAPRSGDRHGVANPTHLAATLAASGARPHPANQCLQTRSPIETWDSLRFKHAGICSRSNGIGWCKSAASQCAFSHRSRSSCRDRQSQRACFDVLVQSTVSPGLRKAVGRPPAPLRLTGEFRGCGGDFADAKAYVDLLPKKHRERLYRESEREADRIVNHEYPFLVAEIANYLYHKSPLYLEEIRALLQQCGPRGLRLLGEG